MKYIWEPEDWTRQDHYRAVGQVVAKDPRSEHFILGWTDSLGENDGARFLLTSLRDGMVVGWFNAETMAKYLNDSGYRPIYQAFRPDTFVAQASGLRP